MKCVVCNHLTRVSETRTTALGLRRRRFCQRDGCGARFTTYEVHTTAHEPDRIVLVNDTRAAALRDAARDLIDLLDGGLR